MVLGGPLDGLAGNGLGEIENGQNGLLGNGHIQSNGTKGSGEIEILERPTSPSAKGEYKFRKIQLKIIYREAN